MNEQEAVFYFQLSSSFKIRDPTSLPCSDGPAEWKLDNYRRSIFSETRRVEESLLHRVLNHVDTTTRVFGQTKPAEDVNNRWITRRLCLAHCLDSDRLGQATWRRHYDSVWTDLYQSGDPVDFIRSMGDSICYALADHYHRESR